METLKELKKEFENDIETLLSFKQTNSVKGQISAIRCCILKIENKLINYKK